MQVDIKKYPEKRICNEFYMVIDFLKKYGATGYNKNWHWARWEWLLGHLGLDELTLPSIGLFMDNKQVAGLVTHDMGTAAYIVVNPLYKYIKREMMEYAAKELSHNGISSVYIDDNDVELISIAENMDYTKTEEKEYVLKMNCEGRLSYSLPSGFDITDNDLDRDLNKYVKVIHLGFENNGEPASLVEADIPERPHFNPRLAVFTIAPNGDYAAHCGMWYMPDTEYAYVEPVATVPNYRKNGLGKAVVYEGINRCVEMGAKKALVISNQQFYHSLGFAEYSSSSLWVKKV